MERSWMSVGAEYVEQLGRRSIEHEIEAVEWQDIPVDGSSLSVGYMPGEAIKQVIGEFGLPRVQRIAISSFERPGFYPGFYGIEAHYKNGRARVYVLDTGTSITPLVTDFWPADGGEVQRTRRGNVEVWEEVAAA